MLSDPALLKKVNVICFYWYWRSFFRFIFNMEIWYLFSELIKGRICNNLLPSFLWAFLCFRYCHNVFLEGYWSQETGVLQLKYGGNEVISPLTSSIIMERLGWFRTLKRRTTHLKKTLQLSKTENPLNISQLNSTKLIKVEIRAKIRK